MVRVERGNVVLDVKEDAVDHYLTLGYNVVDEKGRIIKASIPTNLGQLQALYVENKATIDRLNNQIAELTKEIEALKSKTQKPAKSKAKEG